MPYKDRVKQLAYQNEWTKRQRTDWLQQNGPCVKCGSWDRLEVDHIDPKMKSTHRIWTWSKARRAIELAKCQVLCYACHLAKTIEQRGRVTTHATVSMYKQGCRCNACRCEVAVRQRLYLGGFTKGKLGTLLGTVSVARHGKTW